jgi:hypothetical protein
MSPRKQINVRASDETLDRLTALAERMSKVLNISVSQADVIQAALIELEKRYPPVAPEPLARREVAATTTPPDEPEQAKQRRKKKHA